MNIEYQLQFEHLPNELIRQIFDYLDIRDIFYGFVNLKKRFNQLIQPFENFHLILSNKSIHRFDYCSLLIDTLIIEDELNICNQFLFNVRHLIIYCSCENILIQINPENFPFLEYISISNSILINIDVYKKLFSKLYLYLKFCNLCGSVPIEVKRSKSSFCCFKMGGIDFETYQFVLRACPNLIYLKFRMRKSNQQLNYQIEKHLILKQLIIDIEISGWPFNDQLIEQFLELVPNIEQLNVYTSNFISKINLLIIEYDWLASIIAHRLVILQKLVFFFRLKWSSITNQLKDRKILQQLQMNFFNVHSQKYQARLMIKIE